MPVSTNPLPSDANARLSAGPRSAAGKAAGGRNAVTHGLLTTHPPAVGAPAQAAISAHRSAFCATLGAAHREAYGSHLTNCTQ